MCLSRAHRQFCLQQNAIRCKKHFLPFQRGHGGRVAQLELPGKAKRVRPVLRAAALIKPRKDSLQPAGALCLLRRAAVQVYNEGDTFALGKGKLLRAGRDVSIFASGIEAAEALDAADALAAEGIDAEVINIHTIKPLDTETVVASVKKTGCAVTAENHSILNALGGAVAETLCEQYPAPLERIGVTDHFGEVGFTDYLMEKYHLKAADIAAAARRAVARKAAREA